MPISSGSNSRTVYTTESGRICPDCGKPVSDCRCKKKTGSSSPAVQVPHDGVVRVMLDKKHRAGKSVTLITGLSGTEETIKAIAADLKRRCGSGGTLKDGILEIQGDHRDTIVEALKAKGLVVKRAGG
jgi:translation initiation factor 1